ncbi:MAG: YdcF family protein [Rikenellaceae bacterium]
MYIFFSRVFSMVANPLTYIFLLLGIGLFVKSKNTRKTIGVIALFIVLIFSNEPLYRYSQHLYIGNNLSTIKQHHTYKYGVILGGYANFDRKRERVELSGNADRLIDAVQLYKKGVIQKIIPTGDLSSPGEIMNKDLLVSYICGLGVDSSDIIIEPYAKVTKEHPQCLINLLSRDSLDAEPFLIITSAAHMKRSLACFKNNGLTPDYYSVDTNIDPNRYRWWRYVLPNFNLFSDWFELFHEWIGLLFI